MEIILVIKYVRTQVDLTEREHLVGPGSESVRQRSVPERTQLHANVTVITINTSILKLVLVSA